MYTSCPHCSLLMAVNVLDLRQGQGYVRCRRCHSIFNALGNLGGGPAPGAAEPPSALPAGPTGPAPAAAPEPPPVVAAPPAPAATAPPPPAPSAAPAATPAKPAVLPIRGSRGTRRDLGLSLDVGLDPAAPDLPAAGRTGLGRAWGWAIGVAVTLVVLGLAARAVHDLRHDLVNVPALQQPLTRLYALLGERLEPRLELSAYDVRQLGAESQPGEPPRVHIRISIANHGTRPMPDPVLRVILLDRFGSRVGLRELTPAEYLDDGGATGLAAGARRDVTLKVPDTGRRAEGFEIDPCLPASRGELRCAHDPPTG